MNSASSNTQQDASGTAGSRAESTASHAGQKKSSRISHENYQKRQGRLIKKSVGRISNNEDISDSSQIAHGNLLANASSVVQQQAHLQQNEQIISQRAPVLNDSDELDNRFESRGKNSALAQRVPHSNDLTRLIVDGSDISDIRQDMNQQFEANRTNVRDSLTPDKTGRSMDMFVFDNQAANEEQKALQAQGESIYMKRQSTGIVNEAVGATIHDVISISTKHRPSITQFSNEQPLLKVNATRIETLRPDTESPTEINMKQFQQQSKSPTATILSSPLHVSTTSIKRPANDQIISIFDGETEKSYLLERKDGKNGADGPNIFKVQEVGTARFKCLPVTDYGKQMILHKQRQQRKVQTASGTRARIARNHSQNNNRAVPSAQQRRQNRCMSNRGASQETFNALRCCMPGQASQPANDTVGEWQEPLSPMTVGTEKAKAPAQPVNENILLHDGGEKGRGEVTGMATLSDRGGNLNSNGAITSAGRELRNSKSTAASGQQRKEVFSKTRVTNEQGVTLTQKHHFKCDIGNHHGLSFDLLNAAAQAQMLSGEIVQNENFNYLDDAKLSAKHLLLAANRSAGGRKFRTSTARKATIGTKTATGGTATGGDVYSERVKCCCPPMTNDDILSAKTATLVSGGAYLSPQTFNCLKHERVQAAGTILNNSGVAYGARSGRHHVQEKKQLRKRAQSHGGASRPMQTMGRDTTYGVGVPPSTLVSSRKQQLNHQLSPWSNTHVSSRAVMQEIQPVGGPRKRNMPKHKSSQLSQQVIKQRLSSYLSLLAGGTGGGQNKKRFDMPPVKSILALGEDLGGDYQTLNELLEQVRREQIQTDEMTELIQGLELVDNVKPLRNTIIESVRAMPSYYAGRVRKDPVKLKQFEMQVGEQAGSAPVTERLDWPQQRRQQQSRSVSPSEIPNTARTTTLQTLINRNRQLTHATVVPTDSNILNRNKNNMMAISSDEFERCMFKSGLASPTLIQHEKMETMRREWANRRVTEKVTTLNDVSAFMKKKPPTSVLIKVDQNKQNHARNDPVKQSQTARCFSKPEYNIQMDTEDEDEAAADQMGYQLLSKQGSYQNNDVGIRKSLTLKDKLSGGASKGDTDSSQRAPNFSSPLDEMSQVRLAPRDNQLLNPAFATSSDPVTLQHSQDGLLTQVPQPQYQMIGQSAIQVLRQNSFGGDLMHQGFPVASETSFGNGGQDLTHVMRNSIPAKSSQEHANFVMSGTALSAGTDDQQSTKKQQQKLMMVSGTAVPQSTTPSLSQTPVRRDSQAKMVKTYEFHLPMHHIREEDPPMHAHNSSAKPPKSVTPSGLRNQQIATQSRYDTSKQGSSYRLTAKKKAAALQAMNPLAAPVQNKRDDISSQMLENETVADYQNSLRNLNIMGSSFYGEAQNAPGVPKQRMNQSQTAISKPASQQKVPSRRNQLAQSLEAHEICHLKTIQNHTEYDGAPISLQNNGEQKKVAKSSRPNKLDSQSSNAHGVECVDCVDGGKNSVLGVGCALHTINDSTVSQEDPEAAISNTGAAQLTSETTKHHLRVSSQPMLPIRDRGHLCQKSIRVTPNSQAVSPQLNQELNQPGQQRAETVNARHSHLNCLSEQSAKVGNHGNRPQTMQTQERKSPTASARQLKKVTLDSETSPENDSPALPPESQQQMSFAGRGDETQLLSNMTPERLAESLQRQIETFEAQSPTPKTYDAFVILQTTNEGGQSELLEINRKNFELFGGKQLDSGMKLTQSSLSQGGDENLQRASQGQTKADQLDFTKNLNSSFMQNICLMSNQQDHPHEGDSNKIEIFNISQGVQTQVAMAAGRNESMLTGQTTPQISRLFVCRTGGTNGSVITGDHQTETPEDAHNNQLNVPNHLKINENEEDNGETNGASRDHQALKQQMQLPRSQESRIRFLEQLLSLTSDQTGPQVQQVPMKQFETCKILPEKLKPKSARGYPSLHRKLQKQFKQPHFKNSQAYMPVEKPSVKVQKPTLLNELRGEKRFKTFRANNELYYRIEASSNVEMKEQNIYNAMLHGLGSSLPSELMKNHSSKGAAASTADAQAASSEHDGEQEAGDIIKDTDAGATMEVKHLAKTLALRSQQQQILPTNGSQLEDRSSDDTSKIGQSKLAWKDDVRPLLPIQQPENENSRGEEDEEDEEDNGSTSKIDGPSQLDDQEEVGMIKKPKVTNSFSTIGGTPNNDALRFKSHRRSRMGMDASNTITRGIHQGQPTFLPGKKRLSQNITQPVLRQVEKLGGVGASKRDKRNLVSRGEATLIGSQDGDVTTLDAVSNQAPVSPKLSSIQATPKSRHLQQQYQQQNQCVVVPKQTQQQQKSPVVRVTIGSQSLRKNHRRIEKFQATIQGTNPALKQQNSPSPMKRHYQSQISQMQEQQLPQHAKQYNSNDVQLKLGGNPGSDQWQNSQVSARESPIQTMPIEMPQLASAKAIIQAQETSKQVRKSRSKTLTRRNENLYHQPTNKQRQLNDLVLQVFADKKHNRRQFQTIDGGSTATLGGGTQKQQTSANSDIPFNLKHKANSSQRSIVSASAMGEAATASATVAPKRQTVHVASSKTMKQTAAAKVAPTKKLTMAVDPDLLKNILSKDGPPPVVVPRSNRNIYQVLQGPTGFDRTINYINYDQKQFDQQQSMYAAAFTTAYQNGAGTSREEPGQNHYLCWPNQISQQQVPQSAFTTDQLLMHEYHGMDLPATRRSGFSPISSSERSLMIDLKGQTSFGSMILGRPCLESGNWKQGYLEKYPQTTMLTPEEMAMEMARNASAGSMGEGTATVEQAASGGAPSHCSSQTQEEDDELIGVRILKVIDETGKIGFQLINHTSLVINGEVDHLQDQNELLEERNARRSDDDFTPETELMKDPMLSTHSKKCTSSRGDLK